MVGLPSYHDLQLMRRRVGASPLPGVWNPDNAESEPPCTVDRPWLYRGNAAGLAWHQRHGDAGESTMIPTRPCRSAGRAFPLPFLDPEDCGLRNSRSHRHPLRGVTLHELPETGILILVNTSTRRANPGAGRQQETRQHPADHEAPASHMSRPPSSPLARGSRGIPMDHERRRQFSSVRSWDRGAGLNACVESIHVTATPAPGVATRRALGTASWRPARSWRRALRLRRDSGSASTYRYAGQPERGRTPTPVRIVATGRHGRIT